MQAGTPSGKVTTLHSFNFADGGQPYGPMMQAANGKFYGATSYGGTNGAGTIFGLDAGVKS